MMNLLGIAVMIAMLLGIAFVIGWLGDLGGIGGPRHPYDP
jgi:hypothetical protein